MPDLPAGTVTFLFTDIEGSTQLLQLLGDTRYSALLVDQRRLMRDVFTAQGGVEVDSSGDAFFVAFPTATAAARAAVEVQRVIGRHPWPPGAVPRVRVGLHTGEPVVTGTGYVGLDVHRAARVCSVGHGGQILISETTRGLLRLDQVPEASLVSLGSHRLKDLQRPEQLFQLVVAGLPSAFPPLRSL
ncbi:MAG TPA: adenylate/guanylate cyclase domain-containing protein, partial [bacterium]|nr:adenylate/guanylate cyclase domain-containing protein [bacterium]